MSDANIPESQPAPPGEESESFGAIFSQYEQGRSKRTADRSQGLQGTVVAVNTESVFLDIGYKTEGILPASAFQNDLERIKPGDSLRVTITGRDPQGYYELARWQAAAERPVDWESLEKAFQEKATIVGTVTAVVKGGLTVDVGVRAFMPASRSGTREAAEMEKLVGQEIRCRISKLDAANEDIVVDRRILAEEEERGVKLRRYSEIKEGDTVKGVVRSLTDYGAFVDIGAVDALLHISDIAWERIAKPADVLTVGQSIEARVLKLDPEKQRISIGMKQLQPHPWDLAAARYQVGERVRGKVTRLLDFGAFVELEPGVEGLIHVSEMSWGKRVKKPGDVVKIGETVEAVILNLNPIDRRISLGLKQALGDPWADAAQRFPVDSVVEGPVMSTTKFGAFVQLADGLEGMIHVGDFSATKRINHPQDVVKIGQRVKAKVLEVDADKRRIKLGIKQMEPTSLEEYLAEHQPGDVVSGRLVEITSDQALVELGEGVRATCRLNPAAVSEEGETAGPPAAAETPDLSSMTSMLEARWKSGGDSVKAGAGTETKRREPLSAGQIRSFRIQHLDADAKSISLELVL